MKTAMLLHVVTAYAPQCISEGLQEIERLEREASALRKRANMFSLEIAVQATAVIERQKRQANGCDGQVMVHEFAAKDR